MTNYEMWKEDTKKLYTLMIEEMTVEDVAEEILTDYTGSYDRCKWCDYRCSCKTRHKQLRLDNAVQRNLCLDGIKKHLEKEAGGQIDRG